MMPLPPAFILFRDLFMGESVEEKADQVLFRLGHHDDTKGSGISKQRDDRFFQSSHIEKLSLTFMVAVDLRAILQVSGQSG
jgi:hypothetical protein